MLTAILCLWPAILQYEKLPGRLYTLRVLEPRETAHGNAGGALARARPPPGNFSASRKSLGALRERPPGVLDAQLPPATLARLAGDDFANGPAAFSPTDPAAPFRVPSPSALEPAPYAGPVTAPPSSPGANPPAVNPPAVNPPGITPISNPVDPGLPVVITPPASDAPVVQPPIDTPVGPPITIDPAPPTVDPLGPVTPPADPTNSGPGGPGEPGLTPTSSVPEPSTWFELSLGAGLIGTALRRAHRQLATALRAVARA